MVNCKVFSKFPFFIDSRLIDYEVDCGNLELFCFDGSIEIKIKLFYEASFSSLQWRQIFLQNLNFRFQFLNLFILPDSCKYSLSLIFLDQQICSLQILKLVLHLFG